MIENLPVWSLYPDWKDGVTETLEFLTSVAESMSASEQRRGLRLTPRQYFELSYVSQGPDRTHFDLLTMRAGGSPCYLPLWHDVELLPTTFPAGSTAIAVQTTYTEFMNCNAVFIGSARDYEVVEIVGRADTLITLTSGLVNDWPKGTRVVPMKKVKLDSQPSTTRHTEAAHTARIKFCSLEDNRTDAESPLNMFGLQYVLEEDPNEVQDLTYTYERLISTLDNTMGIPAMSDVTGRVLQQFSWWKKGRAATHALRGLFYSLDGRRVPIWVPTIYADFEPVTALAMGNLAIDVKQCGFTALGGPGPQREYILIQTSGGTRYYHKITSSVILGSGNERLFIATPIEADIPLSRLNRISFLVLCRLDGDSIEMLHHTATRGMTTTVVVFRSAAARDGIENIEVPPEVLPNIICVDDFQWRSLIPVSPGGIGWFMRPTSLDAVGNFYNQRSGSAGVAIDIYNTNGVLISTLTPVDVGAAINARAGSPVFHANPAYDEIFACPIRQGRYILTYVRTVTYGFGYDRWWVLMDAVSREILGMVFTFNIVGPPYMYGIHVHEAFDDGSPILVQSESFAGSFTAVLQVLPSINQFLSGTYDAGYPGYPRPYQIPGTVLSPLGNYNLSKYLFVADPDASSHTFGFRLPGIGRQLFYIYVNRSYMDMALGSVSLYPSELRTVLQPVYPFGLMLKIPLGDVSDFSSIADIDFGSNFLRGRGTEMYTIDNAYWQDADAGPAIPFLDEYTRLADGSVGGTDCYSAQVSTQLRTNGRYWVIFVMAGTDDARFRALGTSDVWASPVYGKVKIFEYDPTTEIAVLFVSHVCVLHTSADAPTTGTDAVWVLDNDNYLIAEIIESGDTGTVILHGPVFKTTFCQFILPEAL